MSYNNNRLKKSQGVLLFFILLKMDSERNKSSRTEESSKNIANESDYLNSEGIRILSFDRMTDECQSSPKKHKKDNASGKELSPNNCTGDSSPNRSTVVKRTLSKKLTKIDKRIFIVFCKENS